MVVRARFVKHELSATEQAKKLDDMLGYLSVPPTGASWGGKPWHASSV